MAFSQSKWQHFTAINSSIVNSLKIAGFEKPTRIQAQVLQQYKNYFDFLIAAQTGSGKTLAFALPILSEMLQLKNSSTLQYLPPVLFGLIITPTRQLAQQIQANIHQVLDNIDEKISVISIIGGMSKQRQLRIIRQKQPHIIIGTPGRIHQFLQDEVFNFQYLKYLVLDQADRMIQLGHFVEVDKILSKIFRPKMKQFYEKDFHQITESMAKKDKQKAKQQQGLYIKQNGKKLKLSFDLHNIESNKLFEVPAQLFQFISQDGNINQMNQEKVQVENQNLKQIEPRTNLFRQLTEQQIYWVNKLKRKIFFVSATLTRQFKGQKYGIKRRREEQDQSNINNNNKNKSKSKSKQNDKKGKFDKDKQKDSKDKPDEQNQLQSIPKLKALLSRVNFSAKPKIIDQSSELFLPQGLTEKISFTDGQNQKISLLLCYLQSLSKNSKVIIFTNTIKASKRVQFFIEAMDFKSANLHSHMQQKQRMTKLERFKKSETINILISTDVAARGLDFHVENVVQYGVPINGDTYVHRAGRTARANRVGQALIIVDRAQGNKWGQINDILNTSVTNRKVDKFTPSRVQMNEIEQKVNQLQWIRVNNQRHKDLRNQKLDQMEAQQLGVQVQEEEKRKKYDLDRQEEQIVRNEVKKKVLKIKKFTHKQQALDTNKIKWKKNKLILSPDQIMKLL